MAELGPFFQENSDAKGIEVTIDMLDYDFVNSCKDSKKLRAILDTLISGKEGHYPDLIRVTEERLLSILSPKERSQMLRLKQQASPQEISEAEIEVSKWEQSMRVGRDLPSQERVTIDGKSIFSRAETQAVNTASRPLPPVRGKSGSHHVPSVSHIGASSVTPAAAAQRISGYDFRAWEKFDVSEALAEIKDDSERAVAAAAHSKRALQYAKKMEQLQQELGIASLSDAQRKARAEREKIKGNEYYRVGENENALACYSRSIALYPTNAVVHANRAMANLRLNNIEGAEYDCTLALDLDPLYIKAWSRRGAARFKMGKYREAADDYAAALKLDSSNESLKALIEQAQSKFREVEGDLLNHPKRATVKSTMADISDQKSTETIPQARPLPLPIVATDSIRNLPSLRSDSKLIIHGKCDVSFTTPVPDVSGNPFVRISIADDDESDSFGAEELPNDFVRVAIVEEDESDEEEDDVAISQNQILESTSPAVHASERAIELKNQGNAYVANRNFDAALQAFTESISLDPTMISSLNNRSQVFLELRRYPEAIADASAVLEKDPTNIKALYRRAVSQKNLGNVTDCILDINRILAIDGNCRSALDLKAEVESSKRQVVEMTLKGQDPASEWDVEVLRLEAVSALGRGDAQRTIELLRVALKAPCISQSNNVSIRDAAQSRTTSLSDDTLVGLLQPLLVAYMTQSAWKDALDTASKIINLQPTNLRALCKRAEVAIQLVSL